MAQPTPEPRDDAPATVREPEPQPSLAVALRFGLGILVAGMAGELAIRLLAGRSPATADDLIGMLGFWFLAAAIVTAMKLRQQQKGKR